MKIMTEEYCRQCPWFKDELGYLPADHPHWKNEPDNECVCKRCSRQVVCEADKPVKDIMTCFQHNGMYYQYRRKLNEQLTKTPGEAVPAGQAEGQGRSFRREE